MFLHKRPSPPSTPLEYAVTHVFFPIELPNDNDYTHEYNLSLLRAVCATAHAYTPYLCGTSEEAQWHHITKMLDSLQASVQSERLDKTHVISQLHGMETGGILAFFIHPQNAAIILMKRENCTLCESFKVSPNSDAVEETAGSLICSYPWSAVEMLNEVFENGDFQFELANFLSLPNTLDSDLPRPPAHPQYLTALLMGIIRGVGLTADVTRITKHVRDNVGQWPRGDRTPQSSWCRSSLWLFIRVAIQMSLDRSPLGCASYKRFMLFFMCTLASDTMNADLSNDLLHLISSKILRRLSKLGSSATRGLSEMALKTCTSLREILQVRWDQANVRPFSFRNPSQDELASCTQLSLLNSCEYIRDALTNDVHVPISVSFTPEHRHRSTIKDFLSSDGSFFKEAYNADPEVTASDIRKSVEQGIDDWLACVTDVNDACTQLGILLDKYLQGPRITNNSSPEAVSIDILTGIDLFIALDKLAVREIPMLADYSPEIPIAFLEKLLLCKMTDLHCLSCAYQYLSARWSKSCPGWSALSNEFTEDSFSVRYYNQSLPLQQLKAHIEANAMQKVSGWADLQVEGADTQGEYQGHQLRPSEQGQVECVKSPLPALLLHAKVVVFELQCPPCIRIWRSAVACALCYFSITIHGRSSNSHGQHNLLADDPALQSYFVERKGPPLNIRVHFVYGYPEASQSQTNTTLYYVVRDCTSELLVWK